MKKIKGFTVIEMMVALAVAGILLVMAVPGFSRLMADSATATQMNELNTAFSLARSEAILRGEEVSVAAPKDKTFEDGWCVHTKLECNDDTRIAEHAPLNRVKFIGDATLVKFDRLGKLIEPKATTEKPLMFKLQPSSCTDSQMYARTLEIIPSGRALLFGNQVCS